MAWEAEREIAQVRDQCVRGGKPIDEDGWIPALPAFGICSQTHPFLFLHSIKHLKMTPFLTKLPAPSTHFGPATPRFSFISFPPLCLSFHLRLAAGFRPSLLRFVDGACRVTTSLHQNPHDTAQPHMTHHALLYILHKKLTTQAQTTPHDTQHHNTPHHITKQNSSLSTANCRTQHLLPS